MTREVDQCVLPPCLYPFQKEHQALFFQNHFWSLICCCAALFMICLLVPYSSFCVICLYALVGSGIDYELPQRQGAWGRNIQVHKKINEKETH